MCSQKKKKKKKNSVFAISLYENKINPPSAKPAKAGGGVMFDLDAITKELKRRKGAK